MAKTRLLGVNPFAFTPIPVTIIVLIVYLAIGISVIVVHESVPKIPSNPAPEHGLNTTEAWLDLAFLSSAKHPYNTHQSDKVRDWLLLRIEEILKGNGVQWSTENEYGNFQTLSAESNFTALPDMLNIKTADINIQYDSPVVTVFNDLQSNVTYSNRGPLSAGQEHVPAQSIYFEGTNIMVYIRGTEDEEGEWWKSDNIKGHGGVLVNAHYDSVSTGFGAADNGVGVITTLQLIKYFTTEGNRPKKGIVALFNNGEEDGLYGAYAFTVHPLSKFAYTFLNLEGSGPGGRSILLRATDTEVAKAYATSPHPYSSVISSDGFKVGVIRSQTDYVVFEGVLGSRGLDVLFWSPRSRYHTEQDDLRHSPPESLWHMLSASYNTMKVLTSDTGSTFDGKRGDGAKEKVKNGDGSAGVWFDIFGDVFAVFRLRSLFAWSLTLLIAGPLILFAITYVLIRQEKLYYFAMHAPKKDDTDETVSLYGWRGAFSFPVGLIFSAGLTVGSAFLLAKVNPLIVYSNKYTVWAMMISLSFWTFWFVMRGSDFVRPSALQRGYAYIWLFILGWAALVGVTVLEDRFQIASGYLIVFYETAVFLATLISFCELFALPAKSEYGQFARHAQETRDNIETLPDSEALIAPGHDEIDDEPTENTPLFRGEHSRRASHPTTFANYARRALGPGLDGPADEFDEKHKVYGKEQPWSGSLPSWTWIIQFLLVAPFMLIILGQAGLFVVQGVNQTGVDGSPLLFPIIYTALFAILFVLPVTPFIHRITYHVPQFLLVVFIGTLIFNLVQFPFNDANRFKAYFVQRVDLETGQNTVVLAGLEEYLRPIIASLPSAAGQHITCGDSSQLRSGLRSCSYVGIPPHVIPDDPSSPGIPPEKRYASWLSLNISRIPHENKATFSLSGRNTRSCILRFARPIKAFHVHGSAAQDPRYEAVPEGGSDEIRLWHRQWDTPWVVDVEWFSPSAEEGKDEVRGIEGRAVCNWSDENLAGVIPALDEIRAYAPTWSAVTKAVDGLVEGGKGFVV